MNFPFLFDYPKRMIYPNDDRQAFENYSDVQYIPGLLHRPVRPGGGRHRCIGAAELRGRKRCIDFGNAGGGGDHPDAGGWIPGEMKHSSSAHRAGLRLVHGIKIRAGQSPALRRYRKAIFYRAFSRPVASLNSLISSSSSLAWA